MVNSLFKSTDICLTWEKIADSVENFDQAAAEEIRDKYLNKFTT